MQYWRSRERFDEIIKYEWIDYLKELKNNTGFDFKKEKIETTKS